MSHRVVGEASPTRDHPVAGLVDPDVDEALCSADHRRGERHVEHDRPRHPVQRAVVQFMARQRHAEHVVDVGLGAELGDEHPVDDDVLAPGALEAGDVPVVIDHVLAGQHEERSEVREPDAALPVTIAPRLTPWQ